MKARELMVVAFVVLSIGLALAGTAKNEELLEHRHACEMYDIWEESGGEHGWPRDESRECN